MAAQPELFSPENLDILEKDLEHAYAAVEISNGKPIKKLISANGLLFVCTGGRYSPAKGKVPRMVTHYLKRVVPIEEYKGQSCSYAESYHSHSYEGVRVTHQKKIYVITCTGDIEITIADKS